MRHLSIILAIAATALTTIGCGNRDQEHESPEAVVVAFNKAITSGEFDKALSLSDSTRMQGFLETCRQKWERLMKEDSTALSIASGILSEAVINVEKTEKDGQGRVVFYRIEVEGKSKQRKATVRKEEGEWKITAITDMN